MNRLDKRVSDLEAREPREKKEPVGTLQLARVIMFLFGKAEGSNDPAVTSRAAAVAAMLRLDEQASSTPVFHSTRQAPLASSTLQTSET
ncbi:MAG: hypothetical protein AAF340_17960 [Pseudomonadota bacterium]